MPIAIRTWEDDMVKQQRKPGDIVAGRRRPRKGEILCHNHVRYNGFRWFSCKAGGDWKVCPCGWRPELGTHYASPDFVKRRRDLFKRLGSWEAVESHIAKATLAQLPAAMQRMLLLAAKG
jgi:hypothetical protein